MISITRRKFIRSGVVAAGSIAIAGFPFKVLAASMEEIHHPLLPDDMTPEEKIHVPVVDAPMIADDQGTVPLEISLDHPMTPEHQIQWIEIWDDNSKFQRKCRFHLTPANGKPFFGTRIRLPWTTTLKVRAKCNIHGIWEAEFDIKVVSGSQYAC